MENIAKLKYDLLKLKASAKTVGDSAMAYQITTVLKGDPPSDEVAYIWDVYVEPLKNFGNALFSAEPVGGYMFMLNGDSSRIPFVNTLYPIMDVRNPWHFSLPIWYYNPSYTEKHGDNAITITSNVPFRVKSAAMREIRLV